MRRGYTIVWCGWIGELLPGDHRLLLQAPVASNRGKPIRGIVRYEMLTDKPVETMPLAGPRRARQLSAHEKGRNRRRADLANAAR